ncbi:MAG: type II toxin-antitoxin system PemK/MazF family toxin [Bacteroidota bacterium]
MVKGDIILIPFTFTDLSGRKNRPAFVLVSGKLDVTVSFISSQLQWMNNSDMLLSPSPLNGLKKKSFLRTSKIATLYNKSLAIGKIGSLSSSELTQVNEKLLALFKLN